MKTARLVCAVLLASLALSSCAAVGDASQTSAAGTEQQTQTEETTTELSFDPGLPAANYNGQTFLFAVRGAEGAANSFNDLTADNMNGDTLNDAIYERTSYIEETYNVKIAVRHCGTTSTAKTGSEMFKVITQFVTSGDTLDAISSAPYDSVGYAMEGYLLDLNSLKHLDLSKPWWDQNARDSLSLYGKTYFTTGDYTTINICNSIILEFTKELIGEYKLDDPYKLVRNGTWTLDAFEKMARSVTGDLNGDGVMTEDDRYGFAQWQDCIFSFIHSTGQTFGVVNKKGDPELSLYSDKLAALWQNLIAFGGEKAVFDARTGFTKNNGMAFNDKYKYLISGKHALFCYSLPKTAVYLRSVDVDFGILPYPKWDEAQGSYYSTAASWDTPLLSVPVVTGDPERTGLILEAFAAKSMELVKPAFYEKMLVGKSLRDTESEDMLDIIFDGLVYDIGLYFAWGNMNNVIMSGWNELDPDLASRYAGAQGAAEAELKKTIEIFSKK